MAEVLKDTEAALHVEVEQEQQQDNAARKCEVVAKQGPYAMALEEHYVKVEEGGAAEEHNAAAEEGQHIHDPEEAGTVVDYCCTSYQSEGNKISVCK